MDATDIVIVSCHVLCWSLTFILCLYNFLCSNRNIPQCSQELTQIRTSLNKHYLFCVGLYLALTAQYLYINIIPSQPTVVYNNTDVTPLYEITGSEAYCILLRFGREYFLSLSSTWIACGLVHLCFMIWNIPESELNAKRITVGLYVVMIPYAVNYIYRIYNFGSCWNEKALQLYTSMRAIVCYTVEGPVLLFIAAMKFVKRPNLATSGPKISYKKCIIIFSLTILVYIGMIVTHSLWLGTNLIKNELHEALYTLLLTTTHLQWIIFYSWGHGIYTAVNHRVKRYKRLRRLEKEMQELTRLRLSRKREAATAESSV